MKYALTVLLALFVNFFCNGQKLVPIEKDSQVSLKALLWDIGSRDIFYFGESGNNFYKAIIVRVPAHTPETDEVMNKVFLLEGEKGEVPDGKLYDLGTYHFVADIIMDLAHRRIILVGGKDNFQTQYYFDLPQ